MSFIDEVGMMLKEAKQIGFEKPESGVAHFQADEAMLKLVRYLGRSDPRLDTIADMYDSIPKYHDDAKRFVPAR